MRFVRHLFISSLCGALAVAAAAQNNSSKLTVCLEQGKQEYAARDYARAQVTFERCLRLDTKNVDTLLSLGGIYLTQDKLDAAETYFKMALQEMPRNSPYFSYTYSMLGDIALKQNKNEDALSYYNRSLRYNEANVNSLVGKGVITENLGDKKGAADIYQVAIAVEPLNLIARKRLMALEPLWLPKEEMLEAMKQRYAVLPDKTELSDQDRQLFEKIHAAEQRGGIDYLKEKYPKMPSDYIAVLFKGTSLAREVLTLSGYNAMQKQVAQDAITVFQKAGVPLKDVFDLRDMRGNKIFTDESTLNDIGLQVYQQALNGKKSFLLPTEPVPATAAELARFQKTLQEVQAKGYVEVTERELAYIRRQTYCSDDTLRKQLGVSVLSPEKNVKRYFVYTKETANPLRGVPWYYVAQLRARKDPSIQVPENTLIKRYERFGNTVCSGIDGKLTD